MITPNVITETALIGVLVLAGGAEFIVGAMILKGWWKLSTATRKAAETAPAPLPEPAQAEAVTPLSVAGGAA